MEQETEFPDIVELNAGGKRFTTSLTTLRKDPDSMLAAMFSGRHPLGKDKDGRYFIDCDGEVFAYILEYLRFGTIPSGEMISRLLRYADYFNIATLKQDLETALDNPTPADRVEQRMEPYQTIYNCIFEVLIAGARRHCCHTNLPLCVILSKSAHGGSARELCPHWDVAAAIKSNESFHLTEIQFNQIPQQMCNDVSKMGYVVKYTVCDCNAPSRADFIIVIASSEDQIRPSAAAIQWTIIP